jgi:hypothetical protein
MVDQSNNDLYKREKLGFPEDYANVPPIILPKDDPVIPPSGRVIKQNTELRSITFREVARDT